MDYDNVQGGNVTLGFPLKVGVNAPDVTVRNVMNIGDSGTGLCYEYDKLYSIKGVGPSLLAQAPRAGSDIF